MRLYEYSDKAMNLFFVGWDLPQDMIERGVVTLLKMTRISA